MYSRCDFFVRQSNEILILNDLGIPVDLIYKKSYGSDLFNSWKVDPGNEVIIDTKESMKNRAEDTGVILQFRKGNEMCVLPLYPHIQEIPDLLRMSYFNCYDLSKR